MLGSAGPTHLVELASSAPRGTITQAEPSRHNCFCAAEHPVSSGKASSVAGIFVRGAGGSNAGKTVGDPLGERDGDTVGDTVGIEAAGHLYPHLNAASRALFVRWIYRARQRTNLNRCIPKG